MRKSPTKAKSEDSPAYISTPAHAALPSHADALRALEGMPTAWVVVLLCWYQPKAFGALWPNLARLIQQIGG